jgi:hypothetical protein
MTKISRRSADSKALIEETARLVASGAAVIDPQVAAELQKIEAQYDVQEVIAAMREYKARRAGPGRPARADRDKILTAAARAMAERGEYAWIARNFDLTTRQLANLVQRNRPQFEKECRQFRKPTRK